MGEIRAARAITPIATVQNLFNLSDRRAGPLRRIAEEHGVTPAQLALAWLLQRSQVLLPIPGTSTVAHLEENAGAGLIELTPVQIKRLDALEAQP